ncbi:MAG: copper chaperone PCu(A)C [Gammaproteobacteria bacterium]
MRVNDQRGYGAALLVLGLLMQPPADAADYRTGNLVVSQPWSSPTPPVASVGAVYFSLTNTGPKAERLMGISSPIARLVEIHQSRQVQGMMQMRAVTFVDAAAGATVKIEPGGLHIMLVGLKRPLTPGMEFPMALTFRDSGVLHITVKVSARQ